MSENFESVDQQLIELLQQKAPEELTFEELDLLRQRLGESLPLRQALAEHLQTESYLTQVLGDFSVSPETIMTRAKAEESASVRPWQWTLGGVVCLGLVAILIGVFRSALERPQPATIADAAHGEKSKKSPQDDVSEVRETDDPAADVPADDADNEPSQEEPKPEPDDRSDERSPRQDPAWESVIAAEQFRNASNVAIDNSQFGTPRDVLVHSGNRSRTSLEYEVHVPRSDRYFLHLRYASSEARPLRLKVNGNRARDIAGEATGGNHAKNLKWVTIGELRLRRGRNMLGFERSGGPIPHLNRIVISTSPTISDATAPSAAPADIAVQEPWNVPQMDDPPSFASTAFDDFDTSKSLPQMPDMLRWFETLPDQQRRIGETHTRLGKCAEFDGVFRLRWPWRENFALRLSLENHNRLRMHFYHGTEGVTLVYYEDEGYAWGAYATTRKDENTHVPGTLALAATDAGRCARSEYRYRGPIDLRWHDGELILSRGDIVLLRAPLKGVPQDVFFDGRVAFHGIAVVPASDAPPREPENPVVQVIERPADLPWFEKLAEGAQAIKHDDGSIELSANNAKASGFISAPLSQIGPCEVIVELEGATTGAGVFLSRPEAKNDATVRFVMNERTSPPSLCAISTRGEHRQGDFGWWHDRLTMHVSSERQYVRLTGGAGIVRHAISPNGRHWAEWDSPEVGMTAGISHLCLEYCGNAPDCRIRLKKITIRRLAVLHAQADEQLLARVPIITSSPRVPTIEQWLADVSAAQPEGVTASAWRRTCAIRALAEGVDANLGPRLVQLVLDDAEARNLPSAELLALYRDAFPLIDTRHNGAHAENCWKRYFTLATRAFRERGERPFSLIRRAAMTSPVWWRHNLPVGDERTIRLELVQLLYQGQWEEALQLCKQLRFFQQHQRVPLVSWAEATAVRQLPGRQGVETSIARLPSSWRPLLVEELSKDAYNVLAEMQAVLESDAFEDAARMITSVSPDSVAGVAPHGRDRQLLVSLPVAIRLAVRDYPQLQSVMNEKFGPLAQLRVRQSINANNVAAVELAAVQFEATEAAAEAHRWLGDRALASGLFPRAMAEYHRALRTAPSTLRHDLLARLRLAAAMQGRNEGEPATRPILFHETTISPGEFESLVADMQRANAGGSTRFAVSALQQRVYPAPSPVGFEVAKRSRLDGPTGNDPNSEVTRDVNLHKVNWAERQIATLVEGNTLYVTNRFQVAAYNLDNGQRLWQTTPLAGNALRSRDWTAIPMRPLVVGDRIYVRLLYGPGPTLACIEKQTGKVAWTAEQRHNEFLISDPLLVQDQLVGFTMVRGEQGQSSLRLTTFDLESGQPIVQRNLARLNDVWWTRRACEVAPLDDGLLATLGGVSLYCNVEGSVRWIRRHISLPPDEETAWVRQHFERPVISGTRAILSQPGVRALVCIDIETGKQLWSHVLPDLETVIGQEQDLIVVRTENAFVAYDIATGQERWQQPHGDVMEGAMLGGPGGFLYVERQPIVERQGQFEARLVWLDVMTGAPKASFTLPGLESNEPHLGPLVAYNDRVWTFWGAANNDPNRDVVELIPKADAVPQPISVAAQNDPWGNFAPPQVREPAQRMFPEWTLLASSVNGESGRRDEVHGEKGVLGLCVRPALPTLFAREVEFADGSHPKLRIRFNHRTDHDWKLRLRVQFSSETVWSEEFTKDTQNQWKDLEIDLSRLAGKAGTLVVRAEYVEGGGETPTWWKRLELSP